MTSSYNSQSLDLQLEAKCCRRIGLIGPMPPPYGGMALQMRLLQRLLLEEGYRVVLVATNPPFPKALSFAAYIPCVRTTLRFFLFCYNLQRRSQATELMHIMANSYLSFFLVTVPALAIGKWNRVPVMVNYRGGLAESFLKKYHRVVRRLLRWADVVVVPNGYLTTVFRQFGISTLEVPNIVPFPSDPARKLIPLDGAIRIFVGRQLEELYDIPCAISAFRRIKDRWPQAVLRIAGEGSQRLVLERMVKDGAMTDVVFLGPLPPEEVSRELDQATVVLNPTRADNMPISILEAFARGVPVVSTNVGGVPYLIQDGITGFLTPPGAPGAMAERVDRLLRDPSLYEAIVTRAREEVKRYRWAAVRPKLFSVYDQISNYR